MPMVQIHAKEPDYSPSQPLYPPQEGNNSAWKHIMGHSPIIASLQEALDRVTLLDYIGRGAAHTIFSTLYYAASKEGSTLPILFPEANASTFPETWDQATTDRVFYKSKKENVRHNGRNCGRKFRKGEPIYRCLDCSFDNTCVLCVHCFNKDDHIGHQVNATICSGANTGICDCGDPEAWKRELHCKCDSHASEENTESGDIFDAKYELYLQKLYDVCLDFIIKVFSHQNQTLPSINGKLKELLGQGGNLHEALMLFRRDIENSGSINPDKEEKCVVLWNDEFHNFHEAQAAIISATHNTRVGAKRVAGQVDKEGRTMLLRGEDLNKMVIGFSKVQLNGLTASIMSVASFRQQHHTKSIIDWILDTTSFPNLAFQKITRRALCKSLCSKFDSSTLEESVFSQYYTEDSGLLNGKSLPSVNHETIPVGGAEPDLSSKLSDFSKKTTTLAFQTRFQYLLFFDIRYWKTLRTKIHDLLIPPLVSDLEYKAIATEQFVEIYGLLIDNLSKLDREPHINSLDETSCQFFTCPTNSSRVVGTDKIRDFLYPIVHLFESHSIQSGSNGRSFKIPDRHHDKSTSIRKSFTRSINDTTYVFEKTNTLDNFYQPENFVVICYLLRLFDSNWKIQRKLGEHVETETYDFVDYFSYTLQLLAVVYAASDATKLDPAKKDLQLEAVQQLLHLLSLRTESLPTKVYKSYDLIDFQVSKEQTGFMNPSNVLLSRLLQNVCKSSAEAIQITKGFNLLNVGDSSLSAIVLCIQIEAQFWVRNGLNALKQAYTYKSPQLVHESVYYRDIHLTQIAMMVSDPERAFLNILNRFELLDWFCNKIQLNNTVYEDKVFTILEKFIAFLYVLLSERSLFLEFESAEKKTRHKSKQVLIYTLYYKPLTYSEIEESLSEELVEFEFLDEVLNEVTIFDPPKGLNDDGRYILKPEYYKSVDPLKLLAQAKDFQDNTTIIAKALAASSNGVAPEDIIIEPKLAKVEAFKTLGDFTRTSEFSKLAYKLLEYAIENNHESYLPQLLHLLHAAFKDDETVHGKGHVVDSFVQIPICESLFAVVSSPDFSKQSTKKADHLLELLIVKDSKLFFESLVSCFGENAVNLYKEKKKSVGMNFDETEPERKRRNAKERQKKILEKMSKKQKLFIQQNDLETQEDEAEPSAAPEDVRYCVLCQGPENNEELFGLPVSYVKSSVFRQLPLKNVHTLNRAFVNWEHDGIGNSPNSIGLGFPVKEENHFNISSHQIATSCNHGMHYRCLKTFMTEHNYSAPTFACPLCKTFHNNYLPVYMLKDPIEQEKLDRNGEPVFENIVDVYMERPSIDFKTQYEESMKIVLGKLATEEDEDKGKIEYLHRTLKVFSSSMNQSEISTRTNGSSSYTNFLTQIPEQTYRVLRGLFQSLMLFQKENGYHKTDLSVVDVSNHVRFMEHLMTDFFTGTSRMRDLAEKLVARDARQYLVSLLHRVEKYGDYVVLLDGKVASDTEINVFRAIIYDVPVSADLKERFLRDDKFARQLVTMVESLLLPQLRSMCIFHKVLFPNFALQNSDEYEMNDLNLLLKSTGLPNFRDIIASPQNSDLIKESDLAGNLPYPGVIKLIDLPTELNYFTTTSDESLPQRFKPEENVSNSNHRIDFSICLTCGNKVFKNDEGSEKILHLKSNSCDSGPDALFLIPNTDVVNLMSSTIVGHYSKIVNAPYLNSHGQSGVKAVQNGQLAKLNIERYKYLNNLWLTGSIFSYLSRNSSPIIPRFGLENVQEESFWQTFLANARTDLEENLDDDQPFVFTFPPGATYVDELGGPGMGIESENSDLDDDGIAPFGDPDDVDDEDEISWGEDIPDADLMGDDEDGDYEHFFGIEHEDMTSDEIDEDDDVDEMNFAVADDMEIEEFENGSSDHDSVD